MTVNRITVLGGTGFVGTRLVVKLSKLANEVTVLTRRRQRFVALKVLNNVRVVETEVHDSAALMNAIAGSDVVVNLVGILNQSANTGPHSFTGAHVDLTASVVQASMDAGVPRYLHMSALHADAENGSSEYLRSKGLAEQKIAELATDQLAYTLFRPSVIFGEEDAFFNRFTELLRVLPVFPLACPDAKLSPVYVDDVCQVMADAIADAATVGQAIELCGPNNYSLRELVQYCADTAGLKRKIIGLPDFAARLQARVMEWVPGKPFSRDNYLSLQTDSVCENQDCCQATSIEAVVPRYIGSQGTNARLQNHRRFAGRDV